MCVCVCGGVVEYMGHDRRWRRQVVSKRGLQRMERPGGGGRESEETIQSGIHV